MELHRSRFFLVMSVVLLLLVLTGFSRTFYLRAFFEVPAIPAHVYVHGAILSGWFLWFVVQTSLVRVRRTDLHRRLGLVGALLGVAVIAANGAVLAEVGPRLRVVLYDGQIPASFVIRAIWGDAGSTLAFAAFLSAGLWFRRRPEIHKRLLFLASVSLVGPALGRIALWPLFGSIRGGIGIGALVLFLGALAVHDLLTAKRIQAATLLGVTFQVLLWVGVRAVAASESGEAIVRAMT